MTLSAEQVKEAAEHTERAQIIAGMCSILFAGEPSTVSGAALAQLVSTFLWGHQIPDDPARTREARAVLLEHWLKTVRDLVDAYDSKGTMH